MVIYRRTSILESTAQTVVNTVNCVGIMGKGLAKAFKERDRPMYEAYKDICEKKLLEPGKLWLWQGANGWVLNFATKAHWRSPSRLEWIEAGLKRFVTQYATRGIKEVSFPRLGCGNGNLNWDDVRPMMEFFLNVIDIPVYIHDYEVDIGLPEHLDVVAHKLQSEGACSSTFEEFLSTVRRISEISGGNLIELESLAPFQAHMDSAGNLTIHTEDTEWVVERDDLRGVWLSLLTGLVTKKQAGWSIAEGGNALLSMLSVLPQARPIQIEGPSGGRPELAVELRSFTNRTTLVPRDLKQTAFSWA